MVFPKRMRLPECHTQCLSVMCLPANGDSARKRLGRDYTRIQMPHLCAEQLLLTAFYDGYMYAEPKHHHHLQGKEDL